MFTRKTLPILTLILTVFASSFVHAAGGSKVPPTVELPTFSAVGSTTATLGGTVTSDGGQGLSARGVEWGTSSGNYPNSVTEGGTATGVFTVGVSGLPEGTLIYFRAWAINGRGTGVSPESSFTTVSTAGPPSLDASTLQSLAGVTASTAILGGNIDSDGNDPSGITERGTVWGASPAPSGNALAEGGTTTGGFSHTRSGLTNGSLIYFRAYATNDSGASYGPDNMFYTEPATSPSFANIDNVGDTSFRITWPGNPGGSGTGALVVVSTNSITATPTDGTEHAFNSIYASGGTDIGTAEYVVYRGTGATDVTVTGLAPSVTYNVAVFYSTGSGTGETGINYRQSSPATNSQTTNAPAVPPTVDTPTIGTITTTTAVLGGTVSANGGAPVTDRGIVWNTTSPADSGGTMVSAGSSGLGSFTTLTGSLPPGTGIFFKAYATNSADTAYSVDELSFDTLVAEPTVTADPASSITLNSAILGGEVTVDGGGTVTDRGTVWDTTPNPTANALSAGSGTGTFSHLRTGLPTGVTVYFRTYASNSAGTAYSADRSFVPSQPPVLSLPTATNITYFSAVLGGTVDNDGGNPILSRGTVWNTTGDPVIENAQAQGGTTVGTFSHTRFLPAGATIYYRAYATSAIGTGYSSQASFTTPTEPTVQSSNISFPRVAAASFRVRWTPGNGEGSIVVVRLQSTSRTDPQDGDDYTGNPDFTLAPELPTNSQNFVVYKGSGSSVLVTGLTVDTSYTVAIYDYAGTGAGVDYLLGPAELSQVTTSVPVHNMDYGIECGNCHSHGSYFSHNTEQENVCKTCHNDTGTASDKLEFALHLTPNKNPAQDYVDCGFCHELHNPGGENTITSYNPITLQTQNNKAFLRANVDKYVPTAVPDDAFLHNDNYNAADAANADTPERAVEGGNDATARGYCQNCHSLTNYHRSSNTAGSDQCHDGEQNNSCGGTEANCGRCHQHNNKFIGVGGSQTCMECHASAQGSRPIITTKFNRLSHHVPGTLDETDCEVCHDQGGHTGGKVILWNTDNHGQSYEQPTANDPTLAAGEGEAFADNCLSCHDSDGAAAEDDTGGGDIHTPLSPFNGSGAPPVIDAATWSTSGHNRDFATFPASPVTCVGDGVTGCHGSGHGAENPAMLAPADTGPFAPADYCYECHDSDGPSSFDTQGAFTSGTDYRVTSMSGAPVNQRHDVSTADQTYSGAVLSCKDCHAVHADNSSNPAPDPDTGLALGTYDISNSYTDDGYNFSYDAGGNLDPVNPEGSAGGFTQPDYIQFCLACHDGTTPPGVTISGSMVNMADAWISDQHGQAEGTAGSKTGKGALKVPYVTAADDAADNDASAPYAAMNCNDCHDSHGSGNIFNLRSEITIAGVQLTVGGTTTLNEPHYNGSTTYDLPLIDGVQVDHYWGAWCTFCHKVDAHPGKVELDACTGGHMHGGGSH